MAATDCLFCKILAGDIPATAVLETEGTFAFRDLWSEIAAHLWP